MNAFKFLNLKFSIKITTKNWDGAISDLKAIEIWWKEKCWDQFQKLVGIKDNNISR
jgi:hypothetical protein